MRFGCLVVQLQEGSAGQGFGYTGAQLYRGSVTVVQLHGGSITRRPSQRTNTLIKRNLIF